MKSKPKHDRWPLKNWPVKIAAVLAALVLPGQVLADFTLNVVDSATRVRIPVSSTRPVRWLAEADTTTVTVPGVPTNGSVGVVIFKSHAPVKANGSSAVNPAVIGVPSTNRYVLSVMVEGYSLGGAIVSNGQSQVTVTLNKHPIPTAQITIIAFVDHDPINNAIDEMDPRLGGCEVLIDDTFGKVTYDAFGNPLGTRYKKDASGNFETDTEGNYVVDVLGDGLIKTLSQRDLDTGNNPYNLKLGEAVIKFLPPNKYGVQIVPPARDDNGNPVTWSQTATIEGTPTIDAWVKANEPAQFVEGFGTGFKHVAFGYVKLSPAAPSLIRGQYVDVLPWNKSYPVGGRATVRGTLRFNHFSKPPSLQGYFPGDIVGGGWIGLNDPNAIPEVTAAGLYAAPCDDQGNFVITNVPAGSYQLVTWDKPLDALFGVHMNNPVTRATFVVAGTAGETINLGDVLCFRWFGTLEGSVFYDADEDGFRDPAEEGIPLQTLNLRFRDGTIYQTTQTLLDGSYEFAEVFPFFKWLIAEVDFARYKPTGMTMAADEGGQIPAHNGWTVPSFGKLNPQPQYRTDPVTGVVLLDGGGNPIPTNNVNTGNNLSRTETGPVLLEGMHLFLGQANAIDWGKINYPPGENGGISGIAVYGVTRAEEDPREAATDPWESGIPRVQFALYQDAVDAAGNPVPDKVIDDINAPAGIQLADVDNYPLGWATGGARGAEDLDRNGNGRFDQGDALQVVWSDSWDDVADAGAKTLGAIQTTPPIIHGKPIIGCDNFSTWNQVRPEVFDGGYAFADLAPGMYIVQSCPPPGYLIQSEESMNVTFGDDFTPSKLAALPECVGTRENHGGAGGDAYASRIVPSIRTDPYTVAPVLSLFPAKAEEAPFAGEVRPLADMKWVRVSDGRNAAADFHLYTEVPKAARAVGFVLNDFGAEFNQASPNFGEKLAVPWIPIAIRDWTGTEIQRIYSDEYGTYNALVPGTYTASAPNPKGLSVNMLTFVLNDPLLPDGTVDPFYNPMYTTAPWTFHYISGSHSYLDTPIVPVAAFTTAEKRMDTEPADGTPMIRRVDGPELPGGGPWMNRTRTPLSSRLITITAMGLTPVINPNYDSTVAGSPMNVVRNYGFGTVPGTVSLRGTPLTIVSWTTNQIVARATTNSPTGDLLVTRGDNRLTSPIGVTFHFVAPTTVRRVPTDFATIQAAIDSPVVKAGDLILVAPGVYNENVVLKKPVKLQGYGAGSTTIFGNPTPMERLQAWHATVDALGARDFATFLMKDPFTANEAPVVLISGEIVFPAGTLQIPQPGTKTFNPGNPFTKPGQALLDGFRLMGSKAGGAVFVLGAARHAQISNNDIRGNQGGDAGGITVGTQDSGFDCQNDNVAIRRNWLSRNSGIQGGGGISMNEASENYLVEDNTVIGNFSRFNGAGFNHRGLSPGTNIVRRNKILFNEDFYAALLMKAGDGGGIYVGGDIAGGTGAGNVIVDGNWIQGNLTASGNGGGINVYALNAQDVTLNPANPNAWFWIRIINNVIVNNVAGAAGGGICLQDAVRATIAHNTIANNDSTATSKLAFDAGAANSTPQGAGIVVLQHTITMAAALGTDFTSPAIVDNIIWHNRSFYNNASLNGGAGGLLPRPAGPYWDLTVKGTSGQLNVTNCLLTAPYPGGVGNISGVTPQFVQPYENVLESTIVIDEMGNNLNVRFQPLALGTSDYHIAGTSPAVGRAESSLLNLIRELRSDVDGQYRPNGAAPDIGADEFYAVPLAVLAVNDAYATVQRTLNTTPSFTVPAPGGVLANDSGPGPLQAVLTIPPANGTLTLTNNGGFSYRVAIGFSGIDTFYYRATSGANSSREAQVTITVNPANRAPVAVNDAYAANGSSARVPVTLGVLAPGVLANDADADGDAITAVLVSPPSQGTLVLNPDGSFNYTPLGGFTGPVQFSYRASDGQLVSPVRTVTITVAAPRPDFVVSAIEILPQPLSTGATFTAKVTVRNQGAASGNAGRLTIWLNQPGVDVPPGTPGNAFLAVGVLAAGASSTLTFGPMTAPPLPAMIENQQPPVIFRAFVNSITPQQAEFSLANNQLAQSYLLVPYGQPFAALPTDTDAEDTDGDGNRFNDVAYAHVGGGDGFAKMADGNQLYTFGFSDHTALTLAMANAHPDQIISSVMQAGMLGADICAPTVVLKEGQRFYFDLSNVGMLMRPDLFDPHTIHFHGYPQAASIFDGEPFASLAVNVGSTFRYYYKINHPGTFIYHCHMEATEHMEMGMLGTIYVRPKQNYLPVGRPLAKHPAGAHRAGDKYVYNDGDGSTYYDVEKELQLGAFDRRFHELHIAVQPLPFATMDESYPLINGRGYPDTINPGSISNTIVQAVLGLDEPHPSQKISSLITATRGQRILLRVSNVSLSDYHTITVQGLPMRVVGKDANLLRGPTGLDLSYETASITLGGGEMAEVILNTTGVAAGTYFLYDNRLNHLCNDEEDFGGMMTEIRIQ